MCDTDDCIWRTKHKWQVLFKHFGIAFIKCDDYRNAMIKAKCKKGITALPVTTVLSLKK